jgi:nanoRNase/pAp phosphatase (c-di-AMP/oligoRNAs hydrolase)
MNPTTINPISRINDVIAKGVAGAVVLPTQPTPDAAAAAASLYLGLTKIGKSVSLVCENSINIPEITACDKAQSSLVTSGDNLIVSFPYVDGSIDKVDYNIQGDKFNLVITPRPNYPKLEPNQVKFAYTGGSLDFIITIDAPTLNSLGAIYSDNQSQFQGKEIINIDRHLTNSFYGTVNFVNKTSSSISELVMDVLESLQVALDKDIATNLYAGIMVATNNLTSYSSSADTFENVARLLRAGAIRKNFKSFSRPVMNQPRSVRTSHPEIHNVRPIEQVEKETQKENQGPPQDWLKPKIFRGGDLM